MTRFFKGAFYGGMAVVNLGFGVFSGYSGNILGTLLSGSFGGFILGAIVIYGMRELETKRT